MSYLDSLLGQVEIRSMKPIQVFKLEVGTVYYVRVKPIFQVMNLFNTFKYILQALHIDIYMIQSTN